MNLGIQDRVAWVVGSSRGIGYAIARRLAEEGCRVALFGRDAATLEHARTELAKNLGAERFAAFAGDARSAKDTLTVAEGCQRLWGRLDILVANAGTGRVQPGATAPQDAWDMAMEYNLHTALEPVRQALPLLEASGAGSIVIIGSIAGVEALGAPAAYAAAKAALHAWAKSLAREIAPRKVRVNTVIPGNIIFPEGTWQKRLDKDREKIENYIQKEVPMSRFGTPAEISDAVAFLASERASFITGASLIVDGGQTRCHQ